MNNRPLKTTVVAAGLVAVFSSREARASDPVEIIGRDPILAFPIAFDIALTTSDVVTAVRGERSPPVLAVAEVILTAPQVLYTGAVLSESRANTSAIEPAVVFVWAGALFAHGVFTLATGASDAGSKPRDIPVDHPSISVAPTMLGADAARAALAPGLVAVGRF